MRLPLALTFALSFLLAATSVGAQRLDLRYEARRECPPRAALLQQIADARGTSPREDRALTATVTVTPVAPRWRAIIVTRSDGAVGERTLEARSCARLTQAIALVIALAIDTEAERPSTLAPSPAPPPITRAPLLFVEDGELPPALRPRPRVARAPRTAWLQAGITARVLLDTATLPEPTPGVSFGVLLGARAFYGRFDATVFARHAVEGTRPGTRTTFDVWTVAALGCQRVFEPLDLCAGLELTTMTARAEGFRQNGSDRFVYLATPVRGVFSFVVNPRFRLIISPEAVFPWTRTEYIVAGVGVVHTVPSFIVRGALAFEARWP